jgi:hypothetical protein
MTDRAFVATRKGLFTLTRGSSGWALSAPVFLGDPVSHILADKRDGTLYAALNLGHFGVKLRRSDDGGKSWVELGVPTYPPQPEGTAGPAWKLDQIWVLEAGGPDEPGTLWAGTLPGGLFRSTDRGEHWQLIDSLWLHPLRAEWGGGGYDAPGIHSICVDPRDSRHVTLAVSTGGVWRTRDRGENWEICASGMQAHYMPPEKRGEEVSQDVHRLVCCAAQPDSFWVQHHNGVYRSTDDAASWQEIHTTALSAFGFAVVVDPNDAQTAWFVPAVKDEHRIPVDGKLAVTRTRDGGRTFDVLRDGLPELSYDLVYRHGFDIDASGTRLIMGSTTGGVWLSEDRGERWQCISAHLPPIYAVRFG